MHIKLTPTIVRRQAEADPSIKSLVQSLVTSHGDDLIQLMQSYTSRPDRPRGDLCPWTPVLDKFDSILEDHVVKYHLQQAYPKPMIVDSFEERLIVEILKFTTFLLEKCSNRSIYGSISHLLCMLKSASTCIIASTITVLSKLPPRIAQTRTGISRSIIASAYESHVRALATILPITGQESIGSSQTSSLISFVDEHHHWSDNWSTVRMHYYMSPVVSSNVRRDSVQTPTRPVAGGISGSTHEHSNIASRGLNTMSGGLNMTPDALQSRGSGVTSDILQSRNTYTAPPGSNTTSGTTSDVLQSFFIDSEEVHNSTIDQLMSKVCQKLPKECWYEAMNKVRVAKSCENTSEGFKLRQLLVQIEMRALVFFSLTYGVDRTTNTVLTKSPESLKEIGDFISVESTSKIPITSKILALETFLEISQQAERRSEVVAVLSANVSHGILMSAIRSLARDLRKGSTINEEYSSLLLMLLSSLSSYQQVGSLLASAGLLSLLLDLIQIEHTPYVRTMAAVVELLDHIIIDIPSTFPQFLEIDGVKILIETARREISYCFSTNRPSEELPQYCWIDYQLSYYRTQWIRSLFVVISNVLIQTRNTQSLQNMVDSSLLSVSSDVITHGDLFGCRVSSLNLQIIANMLEHESTAFSIMAESGLIELLIDHLSLMLDRSHGYYVPVTKIIGSLAHNEGGLKLVKERKLVEILFAKIIENLATMKDTIPLIATILDGITADHTELRPLIVQQAIYYLQCLPGRANELVGDEESKKKQFYTGRASEYYEGYPAHEVVSQTTIDAYYLVDQAVGFLEALSKNHLTRSELISQHAIEWMIRLCDVDGLPFDFAYTKAGIGLGKVLRSLFTLDIDTESFEKVFCTLLWDSFDMLKPMLIYSKDGILDKQLNYLIILSRFNSYFQLFYQMVFFEYGTGYRVIVLMEKIVKTVVGNDNLMSRISEILRYSIWDDALAVSSTQEPFLTATKVISIDGHGAQAEDIKRTKKAVEQAEQQQPNSTISEPFHLLRVRRYLSSCTSSLVSKVYLEFANVCCHDRTLQPTRWTDASYEKRKSGIRMAENIGIGLNGLLDIPDIENNEILSVHLQYLVSVISVIRKIILKYNNYDYPIVLLGVVVQFKQVGGIMRLMEIWEKLWKCPLLDETELSTDDQWKKNALLNTLEALISLVSVMTTSDSLLGTKKVVFALEEPGPNEWEKEARNRFSAAQFLVETKLMIAVPFKRLWNDNRLLKTNSKICSAMIDLLKKISSGLGETSIDEGLDKDQLPRNLDWRNLTPSQDKIEVLGRYGIDESSASKALISSGNNLKTAFLSLLPEGTEYNEDYVEETNVGICPIDPNTGERLVIQKDLNDIRESLRKRLSKPLLDISTVFPDCIYPTATFLIQQKSSLRDNTSKAGMNSERSLLNELFEALTSENNSKICAASHLLGILVNESTYFSEYYEDFLLLTKPILVLLKQKDCFQQIWYPNILLLTEKIVTFVDIPVDHGLRYHNSTSCPYEIRSRSNAEPNFSRQVFDIIKYPQSFTLDVCALSITRLYVHYSRHTEFAMELMSTGATKNAIKSLYQFIGSPIIKNLQTSVTLLLRVTVENPRIIKRTMDVVLQHCFSFHPKVQTETLLKTNGRLYARSPEIFIASVCEYCYYTDKNSNEALGLKESLEKKKSRLTNRLQAIESDEGMSTKSDDETSEMSEAEDTPMINEETNSRVEKIEETKDEPTSSRDQAAPKDESIDTDNHVGIIEMLVDEIFNYPLSEILKEEAPETNESDQPKPENHKEFIYVTYLFQILSELLQSYNSCKYEFVNYQIGRLFKGKNESALSYLLRKYLPDNGRTSKRSSLVGNGGILAKKQSALSTLTKNTIICLASASGELGHEASYKQVCNDSSLVFTRKTLIDSIITSLRDKENHFHLFSKNFKALDSLFELCYELLTHKNQFYHSEEVDGSDIARVMFEKKLASKVVDILSHLDLNHPETPDVVKSGLRLCLWLSRSTMDIDSLPNSTELDLQDAEVMDEDEEDRDETPNIFRNSTLGMYDTEDMFEEEEEEMGEEDVDEEEEDRHANGEDMYYEEVESDAYSDVEESNGEITDESGSGSDSDGESVEFVVEGVVDSEDDDEDMIYGDNVSDEEDGFSSNSSFMYDFDEYEESSDDDESVTELVRQLGDGQRPVRYSHRARETPAEENDNLLDIQGSGIADGHFGDEEAEVELLGDEEDEDEESDIDDGTTEGSEFSGVYFELNNMSGRVRADRAFLSLLEDLEPDQNTLRNPLLMDRRPGRNERDHGLLNIEQNRQPDRLPTISGDNETDNSMDYRDEYINSTLNSPSIRRRHSEGQLGDIFASIMKPEFKSIVPRWLDLSLMFEEYVSQDVKTFIFTDIYHRIYQESMDQLKEIEDLEIQLRDLKERKLKEKDEEVEGSMRQVQESMRQVRESIRQVEGSMGETGSMGEVQGSVGQVGSSTGQTGGSVGQAGSSVGPESMGETEQSIEQTEESTERPEDKDVDDDVEMQEVEPTEPNESNQSNDTSTATSTAIVSIGGRDIDVTSIGIDPTFLEALPDDIREEALTQHLREMLAAARTDGEEGSRVLDPEFLRALPQSILEELDLDILRGSGTGQTDSSISAVQNGVFDTELLNFWASLDRPLRQTLLLEQDDETLSQLPSQIADQAYDLRSQVVALGDGLSGPSLIRTSNDRILTNSNPGLDLSMSDEEEEGDYEGESLESNINNLTRRREKNDKNSKNKSKKQVTASHLSLIPKNGIASLVRLLYLPQSARQREYLNELLLNLCNNKHSRNDILNFLLHIIQDGSSDKHSVEKGFVAVTNRSSLVSNTPIRGASGSTGTSISRNPSTPKSSSKLINSNPSLTLNEGVSPVIVTQQVLEALEYLVRYSGVVKMFFLSEHDLTLSSKKQKAIKEKGKDKELKESRYPINILFGLLDRKIVLHNSFTLELLSALIQEVTRDLPLLLKNERKDGEKEKRKGKEKEKDEKMEGGGASGGGDVESVGGSTEMEEGRADTAERSAGTSAGLSAMSGESTETPLMSAGMTGVAGATSTSAGLSGTNTGLSGPNTGLSGPIAGLSSGPGESSALSAPDAPNAPVDIESDTKSFTLPIIPTKNLKKICAVLTEKECSSRTFQQILDVIHNLSIVPSIGDLIGQELVAEVTRLGPVIVSDLKELLKNLSHVNRGLDVQGNILNKFCSGGADQVKLLRLLTAIDYLFVPENNEDNKKNDEAAKILKSLYEQMTFGSLWGSLSDCLDYIQERKDMIHVATALLPIVEALMVFCKHSPVKDMSLRDRDKKELHPVYEYKKSDIANEPLESLFFSFTDQHRKILNQMIRNNPKLMSGSFSILFKNPRSLDFDNKRRFFYRRIYSPSSHSLNTISLNVRRDHVFLDSYKALYFKTADEIKNSRLNIRFQGEEGIDAGGVTREWFQALSRQMMNPDYALFTPVASDRTSFHPNRTSWVNPEHLSFFKFIGRIIGKAIYDYKLLDCHFSRPVYRKVLGKSVSIKDMEALDLDYYKSLMWMLENDITDVITETFSIEAEDYGEQKVIDLKPGGRNIPVTDENKQEYVKLVVEYRLIKSVQEQMDHFLKGFHDIIPKDVVAIFDEQELELLISGMPDIDTDDWRNNTEYNNYSPSSPQVKWFWRAVKSFDAEEKAKLLQFATGTSKVPLNGFAKLEGMNDITKFSIHRDFGGKNRLPSSHTCFNQVDLPEYDSYEELRQALLTAITEGREGFGLV